MKLIADTDVHYKIFTVKYDAYSFIRPFTGNRFRFRKYLLAIIADVHFLFCREILIFTKFLHITGCISVDHIESCTEEFVSNIAHNLEKLTPRRYTKTLRQRNTMLT